MGKKFKCHKISEGCVEAQAVISKDKYYVLSDQSGNRSRY